jgi:hypothetical protein
VPNEWRILTSVPITRHAEGVQIAASTGISLYPDHGTYGGDLRAAGGECVPARVGTAYAGICTDEVTYRYGATALAQGLALRAVERLLSLDKDTLCSWLPRLGEHCHRMMNYFFRNLHLSECQLDELWTFIYKKEEHLEPLEQLLGVYGDAWVWIAFDPACNLVPAGLVCKGTTVDDIPNRVNILRPLLRSGDQRTGVWSRCERHHAHCVWHRRANPKCVAKLSRE